VMSTWTAHSSESGRTFYYDCATGRSQWEQPVGFGAGGSELKQQVSLQLCADSAPVVVNLLNAIIQQCGVSAIPTLASISQRDPFCDGGRGGAYVRSARLPGGSITRTSQRLTLCAWAAVLQVAADLFVRQALGGLSRSRV